MEPASMGNDESTHGAEAVRGDPPEEPMNPPTAKERMLGVRKLETDMTTFLFTRLKEFAERMPEEMKLLQTKEADAVLGDLFADIVERDNWTLQDLLQLSSSAFLMAISFYGENHDDEPDESADARHEESSRETPDEITGSAVEDSELHSAGGDAASAGGSKRDE